MAQAKQIVQWSAVVAVVVGLIARDLYAEVKEGVLVPRENRKRIERLERLMVDMGDRLDRCDSTNKAQWRVISNKKDK